MTNIATDKSENHAKSLSIWAGFHLNFDEKNLFLFFFLKSATSTIVINLRECFGSIFLVFSHGLTVCFQEV